MKEERQRRIADYVAQHQSATMEELCQEFQVSINTIRADVARLVKSGALEKVYGGVRSIKKTVALFDIRAEESIEKKRAIAKKAADFVEDHDTIYIDNGTTTMYLPDYLDNRRNVTIITTNLSIISNIYSKVNLNLIVLPGMLNRRTNAFMDTSTFSELKKYQPDKAFMATTGITRQGNLNVSTYLEYEIKKTAVEQCGTAYLLADSRKFDETSLLSYGNLRDMSRLITDGGIGEDYLKCCEKNQIAVEIV